MSALRASSSRLLLAKPATRGFRISAWMSSGKEDSLHEDIAKRQETVHTKKEESLSKREWQAELASNSESIVKAERGEVKSSEEHIKELQKETEEVMNRGR